MKINVDYYIGYWSGEKCNKCGCEKLKNNVGDFWCSNIDCDDIKEMMKYISDETV